MTEQEALDSGAECVLGDLILNRVVVGHYRGGQYIPSEAGLMVDAVPAPVPADESRAPAPTPESQTDSVAPAPRRARTVTTAPVNAPVPGDDPLAALDSLPK